MRVSTVGGNRGERPYALVGLLPLLLDVWAHLLFLLRKPSNFALHPPDAGDGHPRAACLLLPGLAFCGLSSALRVVLLEVVYVCATVPKVARRLARRRSGERSSGHDAFASDGISAPPRGDGQSGGARTAS